MLDISKKHLNLKNICEEITNKDDIDLICANCLDVLTNLKNKLSKTELESFNQIINKIIKQ